jgi:hypothetical protein
MAINIAKVTKLQQTPETSYTVENIKQQSG